MATDHSALLAETKVQLDQWIKVRDKRIRDARAEGLTLEAIAKAAGLSRQGVMKILTRTAS